MWEKRKSKQGRLLYLSPERIRPNPSQPRRSFAEDKLAELAQSIRENGLLQPLTVTLSPDGEATLIAGERRLRAAIRAGLSELPCLAVEATGEQSAVLALVENLQRQDLNCFEQAESIDKLIRNYGLTQEETARRLGCSQPTVANKLRLLALTREEREALLAAGAGERHARALLRLPEGERRPLIERLAAEHWTVARTEQEVEKRLHPPVRRRIVPLIRDVRLFFNTVSHAVETMRRSGVPTEAEQNETELYYEYTIRIPKEAARRRA